MRIQTLLLVVAFLAFPVSAQAITWSDCHGNTGGNLITVTAYQLLCADFDETDSGDSRIFTVGTNRALLCFDPDIASEGAATAEINFRYCPNSIQPGSAPENQCFTISDAPFTGATGSAGTQDACERVGPGTYMFEITTQSGSEDARVTIQGEAD